MLNLSLEPVGIVCVGNSIAKYLHKYSLNSIPLTVIICYWKKINIKIKNADFKQINP